MNGQSPSTHSGEVRRALDLVIKARSQYASYLHQVANGERPADTNRRNCLKRRCEVTLEAWRLSHEEWKKKDWPTEVHLPDSNPPP
ncbi:MAG: hypothetical protein GWO11_00230 [Desulfuromonadales bacterium]|nr:hypothetical protein [Desulfuromonadales bacterium]NIR32960.1 hypothetical protein [Desulfuromonadales bacterium]NIS40518.1 hypothetical protein [Desulfuromonadales bacterium]